MTRPKPTIWQLVQLSALDLTKNGVTPFTRSDLVRCVQRADPSCEANSINPIIQGVTDNLRGGALGAVGKNILHSVGRGLFVLKDGNAEVLKWQVAASRRGSQRSIVARTRSTERAEKATASSDDHPVLRLGDYEFHHVSAIEPEQQADGSLREFMPQARYGNKAGLSLNRYGNGPFCKFKIPRNVDIPGVYAVVVNGEVRYIGECAKLRSRFNMGYGNISPRNCFLRGQETNCRINSHVLREAKAGSDISLWFLATDDYKVVEKELRNSVSLSWNRV